MVSWCMRAWNPKLVELNQKAGKADGHVEELMGLLRELVLR